MSFGSIKNYIKMNCNNFKTKVSWIANGRNLNEKMGFSGLDIITFGSFTVYKKPVKMFTFSTAVKNIKH